MYADDTTLITSMEYFVKNGIATGIRPDDEPSKIYE